MRIHIPTTQYGFIEADVSNVEEARDIHDSVTAMFSAGNGIPDRDFNAALDRYLTDGTGETETFLAMSPRQQDIIQAIKRSYKRIGTLE